MVVFQLFILKLLDVGAKEVGYLHEGNVAEDCDGVITPSSP
jgi:hypothetical protein